LKRKSNIHGKAHIRGNCANESCKERDAIIYYTCLPDGRGIGHNEAFGYMRYAVEADVGNNPNDEDDRGS
jgi:hypothetical protein